MPLINYIFCNNLLVCVTSPYPSICCVLLCPLNVLLKNAKKSWANADFFSEQIEIWKKCVNIRVLSWFAFLRRNKKRKSFCFKFEDDLIIREFLTKTSFCCICYLNGAILSHCLSQCNLVTLLSKKKRKVLTTNFEKTFDFYLNFNMCVD